MKFDDLDAKMRAFEDALDARLPASGWVVARLDGRGFSKLTRDSALFEKGLHVFEKPFDQRFRDMMLQSARVVAGEFGALFAHTHSDEMSLLLAPTAAGWPFEGKARKYLSLMASSASVAFALALKHPVSFDCRLVALPRAEDVVDYFRWRMADSERNALSAHCYWNARAQGLSARYATKLLDSLSPAQKIQRLQSLGVDYACVPPWHRRGVGLSWHVETIEGRDPRSGVAVAATRRRLRAQLDMPEREELAALVKGVLEQTKGASP